MKKIILTNLLILVLAVISPMHAEVVVKHAEAGGLAAGSIIVTPKWADVSSVSLGLTLAIKVSPKFQEDYYIDAYTGVIN